MMVEPTIGRATENFHTKVPPCIAMDAEYKGSVEWDKGFHPFQSPEAAASSYAPAGKV